jgi:peroxiredoxin
LSEDPRIGDAAPAFTLPDTAGEEHGFGGASGAPATVVFFTCNHCPYALAWHDRLMRAGEEYAEEGIRFLAINPNDAERYPLDSYEAMQARVEREGDWPIPYLRDETQEVAAAWGARTTPDVFVVDQEGRIVYRGAPDADHDDESQDARWLREALNDVLSEREVARPETEPVGCSIKWK